MDLRSLAVFRMALGLLLFCQTILLLPDFDAFYGAGGVSHNPNVLWPDLLPVVLFAILPLCALSLLVGWLNRLSTLLCFLSLLLVQKANSEILQGGDVLLRLLLFWSLFLPLGQVWSIDARLTKAPSAPLPVVTRVATWTFTLQICFVYWFAALLKTDPLWTQNGNALFYALNIEHFTTPLGLYLRQFPDLLRIGTFGTPWLEFLGPLLLFIPYQRNACRLLAVVLFVSFHLIGLQCLLRVGLFPCACATAWLAFIPGSLWDGFKRNESSPTQNTARKGKRPSTSPKKGMPGIGKSSLLDYGCTALVILACVDVLAWNIASVSSPDAMRWVRQHDTLGNVLGLQQRWNMYAPRPRSEHGWLVVPADLANGTQVDLFTGQPVSWEKPKDIGAYFGDDRWRRYLSNLFDDRDPEALQGYADYLVHRWNQSHDVGQKIEVVTIVFMKQVTQPALTVTPPEKDVLYFHSY